MTEATDIQTEQAISLKGGLFTLTVAQVSHADSAQIADELTELKQQLPNFFSHTPVVLDLTKLTELTNLGELIDTFIAHHMIPVGIRSADTAVISEAREKHIAIMPLTKNEDKAITANNEKIDETKTDGTGDSSTPVHKEQAPTQELISKSPTKVITQPVRSGQQIYAKGGDLIVLASVSHGAELLADGNITVYGALRGRALAGIHGDENAHILCSECDAELISIAGRYLVRENLNISSNNKTKHIYLDADGIKITYI